MFKILFVILSVIHLSRACRVIEEKANGETSPRESSSSLVLLEGYILTAKKKYFCSGVLISPEYVLTTRYCVFGLDFVNVHVYANNLRDQYEDGREIHRATEFFYPDNFDGLNHINDITLIKMPDLFTLKNYITVAKLPENPLIEGVEGKTFGWGLLDYIDDHAASYKQELPIKAISQAECEEAYSNLNWAGGSLGRACIKVSSGTNCVSDNSSPFMMIDGVVYGLQSYGQMNACDGSKPNLIQDIFYHRDWIRTIAQL